MENLIKQAQQDLKDVLSTYASWSDKFEYGSEMSTLYSDLIEFVNARMETVGACRVLLENERVADSLGLSRSLLENLLLYILMCRGEKYYRIRALRRGENIDQIIEDERKHIGTKSLVGVEEHPTLARRIMYIFEGLKPENGTNFIPYYFFTIQEFSPESMRLNGEDYFTYYDVGDEGKARDLEYQKGQVFMYQHYLSYEALLRCLTINEITDEAAILRVNAHYTFLGKFLHPTYRAAQSLRQHSNSHGAETMIGAEHPYEQSAVLLAYNYVIHNAIGFLEELASVLDNAPKKNFKSSGSEEVHEMIKVLKERYAYFWYVFNSPSDHAKFNYCIHQLSDEELAAIDSDYRKVEPGVVTFDKNIYKSFSDAMTPWHNARVGSYEPPYSDA